MGVGLKLGIPAARSKQGGLSAGDIVSLTVRDSTTLQGINGQGYLWELEVYGTALGQTSDASKIVPTSASAPGFDATGAPTTRARPLATAVQSRKPVPTTWTTGWGPLAAGQRCSYHNNVYLLSSGTTTGATPPTHVVGTQSDGGVSWTFLGATTGSASNWVQPLERANGSNTVATFVGQNHIYTGEVVTAAIGAGAYGSSYAANISVTNNSDLPWPRPHISWATPEYDRVTGTAHCEVAVFYPPHLCLLNRPFACVIFKVVDGTYTGSGSTGVKASVTVTALSQSTNNTGATPLDVAMADIALGGLGMAMGRYYWVVEVYPWFGNVTYKSYSDGYGFANVTKAQTLSANTPKSIPFLWDDGTYGAPVYAYFDPTFVGTPAVSTNAATARLTPYNTTLAAALAAGKAFNNANYFINGVSGTARNDCGGVIVRMFAGTYDADTIIGDCIAVAGAAETWAVIERDLTSAPNYGDVIINGNNAGGDAPTRRAHPRMRLRGIKQTTSTNNAAAIWSANQSNLAGPFTSEILFDGSGLHCQSGQNLTPIAREGLLRFYNCPVLSHCSVMGVQARRAAVPTIVGCDMLDHWNCPALNFLGVTFGPGGVPASPKASLWDTAKGELDVVDTVISYRPSIPNNITQAWMLPGDNVNTSAYATGWVVWEPFVEITDLVAHSSVKGGSYYADAAGTSTNGSTTRSILAFATLAGDGFNINYNEAQIKRRFGYIYGCFFPDHNCVGDNNHGSNFADGTRVLNWDQRYNVDCLYNVVYQTGSITGSPTNLVGEYIPPSWYIDTATNPRFINDASNSGTKLGNGDYHPSIASNSIAIGFIPAGKDARRTYRDGSAINPAAASTVGCFPPA